MTRLQSKNYNRFLHIIINMMIPFCRILMSEAYTSIDNTMKYYGSTERKGVHIPFNFQLIRLNKDSNAIQIVASINEWLSKMPKGQIANWVVSRTQLFSSEYLLIVL